MHNRSAWRRPAGIVSILLIAFATVLGSAEPAGAAPWGTSGADYNGVLCRIGGTDIPMGSWTVNGTVSAYSTRTVTGSGGQQQSAPVSGSPTTMTVGQAGFSQADIGAVAYLLARHGDGSAAERAEVSTDVALVAGSGQTQLRCLGQNGTSARRAADRLDAARRFAGPYTVEVRAQSGVILGGRAEITATVRSASGSATPGLPVSITAGSSSATAVTGGDGVARTTVAVPATAAATLVTATVAAPTGLVYIDTTPPSVAPGPLSRTSGSTTLRPVLHPKPAVSLTAGDLLLSGGSTRPTASVTGTFGYSGTGDVTLLGPLQPASNESCASIPAATLSRAAVRWQDTFTFRGDAQYRASSTPDLAPGCYALRASVTTTNSVPPERATSPLFPLTVATLKLTSTAAAKVALAGGLAATVTGATPGRAAVTTTVEARGPLPVRSGGCAGDFDTAPVAGSSASTPLRRVGAGLQAAVTVPDVRESGCYALVARNEVTLDGRRVTTRVSDVATSTTAVLRPSIVVAADAMSGEQGQPMPGTVRLTGTFGFDGVVAVGVVPGSTIPNTGCRDSTFATNVVPTATIRLATKADGTYPFRTPATTRNACYTVTATFTLAGNPAVAARSGRASDSTVFLAGVRPDAGPGGVVQRTAAGSNGRALITYGVTALLVLVGCGAIFVRTLNRERQARPGGPLFSWRPNRDEIVSATSSVFRRPLPGNGPRPRPSRS